MACAAPHRWLPLALAAWGICVLGVDADPDEDDVTVPPEVTVVGQDFTTGQFPYDLNLAEMPSFVHLMEPFVGQGMEPFVVQGMFSTRMEEGFIFSHLAPNPDDTDDSLGLTLRLDEEGRVLLRVIDDSHESVSRSQQVHLNDGRKHEFKARVTLGRIQVSIDELLGTSALRVSCGPDADGGGDDNDFCAFSESWLENSIATVGGNPRDEHSQTFVGDIENFALRRMHPGEAPRRTALDDDDDDGEAQAASGAQGLSSRELLFMILIPSVLLLPFCAVSASALIWYRFYVRPKLMVANSSGTPPATVGALHMAPTGTMVAVPGPPPDSTILMQAPPPPPLATEISYPPWWTARPPVDTWELVPVSSTIRRAMQDLMDSTWKEKVTRDRPREAGRAQVSRFEVVQVNRNENLRLWREYVTRRGNISGQLREDQYLNGVLTECARPELGATDGTANEFLLWHGTKPSACANICKDDFLLNLAGSHRGTLYGHGLYFAESVSKSDEYADDDKDGPYKGLYAMLLCRVTLGKSMYTADEKPDGDRLRDACVGSSPEWDSVLGDREKVRGTYREFIVYNNSQAYPEYVVIYRRESEEVVRDGTDNGP